MAKSAEIGGLGRIPPGVSLAWFTIAPGHLVGAHTNRGQQGSIDFEKHNLPADPNPNWKANQIDFEKHNVPRSVVRRKARQSTRWGEEMARGSPFVSRISSNSVFKHRVYHRRLDHASQRFCHTDEVVPCDRRKGQGSPNNRHRRPNTAVNYISAPYGLQDPSNSLRPEDVAASLHQIGKCLHSARDLGLATPLARTHSQELPPGPAPVAFSAEALVDEGA